MSTLRVIFLGTGGALNYERYQASILVDAGDTRILLDTGGGLGLVRRLRGAGVDPASVGHVFLSHRHLDHIGGLEPLLLSVSLPIIRSGGTPPTMRLYASPDSGAAIRSSLAAVDAKGQSFFGDRLAWVTPDFGKRVTISDGIGITTVPVDHLPPGGGAAACVIDVAGRRIVYSGDTRPCSAVVEAARGADLLIHEVGGLDAQADAVHLPGHSTGGDVGRVAAQAGARAVALVHIPPSMTVASADLVAETRRFAGRAEVFMSEDGLTQSL